MLCFEFMILGGDFILHDSVFEGTSFDDEGNPFMAVQSSPFLRRRLSELEHHRKACSPGAAAFGLAVTKTDGRERRFNRVGRPQVTPVFGWKVVERHQHVAVFLEAFACRCVLRTELFQEVVKRFVRIILCFGLPDFVQVAFRFGLNTLGHLVQNVGRLVNPAALLTSLWEHFADRRPEAQSTVANGNLRRQLQAALLEVDQQLAPALLAFAVAVEHRDQLFLAIGRCPHQYQ